MDAASIHGHSPGITSKSCKSCLQFHQEQHHKLQTRIGSTFGINKIYIVSILTDSVSQWLIPGIWYYMSVCIHHHSIWTQINISVCISDWRLWIIIWNDVVGHLDYAPTWCTISCSPWWPLTGYCFCSILLCYLLVIFHQMCSRCS